MSDLGVSVITTKRAYADLEQLGFICTVQGKGCFVAEGNQELLRETIYEQISSQVKAQILSGTLTAGAKLPSIRALVSDLGVSVITTKRAYADLEQLGFICTVQGKGCFVAEGNQELLRENQLCHIEELLAKAASQAETLGVTRDKLHEMLDLVAPETMQ